MSTTNTREITKEFGARLALIRWHMQWTFTDAAKVVGVSGPAWTAWEYGTARPRNMDRVVDSLAETTGLPRSWIMWGEDGAVTSPDLRSTGTRWSPTPAPQPSLFDLSNDEPTGPDPSKDVAEQNHRSAHALPHAA